MLTWIIIAAVILILVIRAVYELHHLKVTEYHLESEKIPANCRFVFLSDLHLRTYGEHNEDLIEAVFAQKPDFILLGGDMTVRKEKRNEKVLFELLEQLVKIAPVFYASGNHETALKENAKFESDRFEELCDRCRDLGIRYLINETTDIQIPLADESTEVISVAGLELPYECYSSKEKFRLTADAIREVLDEPDPDRYSILLAHCPAYFDAYAQFGTDLVLSGHYHGGAIRFGKAGLVSPQVRFFPKYSAGKFVKANTTMIVTRGIGSHSVNLRLFNYPEVVAVTLHAK